MQWRLERGSAGDIDGKMLLQEMMLEFRRMAQW